MLLFEKAFMRGCFQRRRAVDVGGPPKMYFALRIVPLYSALECEYCFELSVSQCVIHLLMH